MKENNEMCEVSSEILDSLNWAKSPLIPVIAQNKQDSRILMLAYANRESLALSLKSGVAHYFSRSKNRIWKKGEESGNIQVLREVYVDCDNDALLFVVEQKGVACHTGRYSCFFRKIDLMADSKDSADSIDSMDSTKSTESMDSTDSTKFVESPADSAQYSQAKSPYHTLDILYHILQDKKFAKSAESYTASLYQKGENTIGKKIAEEAAELAFAIKDNKDDEIVYECADLLYHALVGLSYRDISPDRVMSELKRRFGTSGLQEKQNRQK